MTDNKMVKIGKRRVNNFGVPYIIAEIGANHNGDIRLAKKLIKQAKAAGADCAKFQLWSKKGLFSKIVYKKDKSLEKYLDKWSFGEREMRILKDYCDKMGISFACTPSTEENVDFLVKKLSVKFVKVASCDINNYPFLRYIARKRKTMVISTGTATLAEIEEAIKVIEDYHNKIVLLHCVALYPPKEEEVNLLNIDTLRSVFKYPVGFSDHTLGIATSLAAVARGACVIEKHFTLDKNMFGWDHKVSADFEDLKSLVLGSRRIHKSLGKFRRELSKRELRLKDALRKSIVVSRDILKDKTITKNDINLKRPGIGLEPRFIDLVIGSKARRNIAEDDLISWKDIEIKNNKGKV